jgi:hypothetical protein
MPSGHRATRRWVPALLTVSLCCFLLSESTRPIRAQADTGELDAFMARVLARRDDNWSRLQQYVLDEREAIDVRGPNQRLLYGRVREFTWYIRDGVFVRSPLKVDGANVNEPERRKYEDEWLAREKQRALKSSGDPVAADTPASAEAGPAILASLGREPQFVSAAYFLKFKFESGRYAFAGAEEYEGRRVYRIEYYPERLFTDDRDSSKPEAGKDDLGRRIERQMNKVALVTLWVQPEAHQIVKYTFDDIGWDFLPGRWFVRMDDVSAAMEMGQPFAGVWLPRRIDGHGAATVASGTFEVRYSVSYENYREATVKARVR